MATIDGILFDSGGVLIGPRGGRWWPVHGFEDAVRSYFPNATFGSIDEALVPAMRYMRSTHPNEDWRTFYRIVLNELGLEPPRELLDEIVAIEPASAIEVFPDVLPCLHALHTRDVPMAVVSDAWPELPDIHQALGIRQFFVGYAISSLLGCTKPDPRMYAEGARLLDLPPEKLLFVDDSDDLVHAAIELGYEGVVLRRSGSAPGTSLPWITTLEELPWHIR